MPKITGIKNQIGELPQHLRNLRTGVYEIGKFLQTLRFIHVTGKIFADNKMSLEDFLFEADRQL